MPRSNALRTTAPAKPKQKLHPAMLAHVGVGRPRGIPNKYTREVKDVIAQCFTDIGGAAAFAAWAKAHPTEFYKLYSKLLPIQLQGAANGNSINIYINEVEAAL
jgi:hypothetical protein